MKRKCFLIFLALLFLLPVSSVSAAKVIDESKLYYYGLNGIYYYRGDSDKCSVSDGSNQNYAGVPVWSEAELAAISDNRSIYEEAANEYDFPWQVLAVLHSMETALKRYNPENGQGVYQLYSYTDGGTNENAFLPAGPIDEAEFRRQTLIAAEIVSSEVGDLNEPDNVKLYLTIYDYICSRYLQKRLKCLKEF